jgi:hypothetical protein
VENGNQSNNVHSVHILCWGTPMVHAFGLDSREALPQSELRQLGGRTTLVIVKPSSDEFAAKQDLKRLELDGRSDVWGEPKGWERVWRKLPSDNELTRASGDDGRHVKPFSVQIAADALSGPGSRARNPTLPTAQWVKMPYAHAMVVADAGNAAWYPGQVNDLW